MYNQKWFFISIPIIALLLSFLVVRLKKSRTKPVARETYRKIILAILLLNGLFLLFSYFYLIVIPSHKLIYAIYLIIYLILITIAKIISEK